MIQFKRNGLYDSKPKKSKTELTAPSSLPIVAIGSAGISLLDQLLLDKRLTESVPVMLIDTDEQVLAASVWSKRMLLGRETLRGLGCRGDIEFARTLFNLEQETVLAQLDQARRVVLVAGFGGGTGSGVTLELARRLCEQGVSVILIAMTPFKHEGLRRRLVAEEALQQIRPYVDTAFIFSAEHAMYTLHTEADVRAVFQRFSRLAGEIVSQLSFFATHPALSDLQWEDFQNLVSNHHALASEMENTWIGTALKPSREAYDVLIKDVLASPFFANGAAWKSADRLLACVECGSDFAVGDYQHLMDELRQSLPVELELRAESCVRHDLEGFVRLTLIAGRSGEALVVTNSLESENSESIQLSHASAQHGMHPIEEPSLFGGGSEAQGDLPRKNMNRRSKKERYFGQQAELPLQHKIFRGRFEKSDPTLLDGQDLDQPTFMRLGLKIKL